MAAFVVKGVSQGLRDFQIGNWSYGDLANGYRSGHGNITSSDKITILNGQAYYFEHFYYNENTSFVLSTWKIFKTTLKALRLAPLVPFFSHHTTAIKTMACGWVGMNVLQLCFGVKRPPATKLRDITLWKATPYLLFALNLFLTTLELHTNPRKVLVSYTVLALNLADEGKLLPKQVSYVMNTLLPLPLRAVSIYYADSNVKRLMLGAEGIIPLLWNMKH